MLLYYSLEDKPLATLQVKLSAVKRFSQSWQKMVEWAWSSWRLLTSLEAQMYYAGCGLPRGGLVFLGLAMLADVGHLIKAIQQRHHHYLFLFKFSLFSVALSKSKSKPVLFETSTLTLQLTASTSCHIYPEQVSVHVQNTSFYSHNITLLFSDNAVLVA